MSKSKLSTKEQQRLALGVVWKSFDFNKVEISKAAGVTPGAVGHWFRRGHISATSAIVLENHPNLKGVITKEEMRPDVQEWFGV